jgi:hypothetical protein
VFIGRELRNVATKYGAKKVEIDGITFDSKIESKYYEQLKWLQANDQILFFRVQPRYLLQDAFEKDGQKYRKIEYVVGDFEVHHKDGSIEVIDVKGMETEAFKLKKKMFNNKYPHKLSLVTYIQKFGGWITLEEAKRQRKLAKKEGKTNEGSKRTKTRYARVAKKSY